MKIAVFVAFPENKGGIPRVAEELLRRFCVFDEITEISIITPRNEELVDPSVLVNDKVSIHPVNMRKPADFLKLIRMYKQNDIFLCMSIPWSIPSLKVPIGGLPFVFVLAKFGFWSDSSIIQVLHDFTPYLFPEDHIEYKRTRKIYENYQKYLSKVPRRYVADSQSTKKDAAVFWRIRKQDVDVVYLGSFVEPKSPRTHFNNKKVLIVSDVSPRKNHLRLLQAFEMVHQKHPDAELTIVGNIRERVRARFDSTLEAVTRRNQGIKISLCGYLTDEEIVALYRNAAVFVYPSLYEGFGLPVLEAMAQGCPVITSNVSSLPEVVGDAAVLIDPLNTTELAQAMIKVLTDDELKREMSIKGINRAKLFSWDRTAEKYVEVFDRVLMDKRAQN
ncbi:MAG: glycosyltransferase family 1 protein [Halobacteriota archaeon]|jgi:glycosyltransferase involved in cell wall biosynthesis